MVCWTIAGHCGDGFAQNLSNRGALLRGVRAQRAVLPLGYIELHALFVGCIAAHVVPIEITIEWSKKNTFPYYIGGQTPS
jgi:hypothetical protein